MADFPGDTVDAALGTALAAMHANVAIMTLLIAKQVVSAQEAHATITMSVQSFQANLENSPGASEIPSLHHALSQLESLASHVATMLPKAGEQ